MAASFPNAKKTFSAVVNGVTKLVAALFNTPYDEIEAIETYVGATGGGTQAYTESLKGLLGSYIRGCSVDYKGAADLYVRLGEISILDASGNMRLRKNTSDLTVTWADIDTGAEANSTRYYVYVVADASATTFTAKISANASSPSGCTFYRQVGSFYNDGSGNIVNPNALLIDTVYQADDHGTVYGSVGATSDAIATCYTDNSNPPTTIKQVSHSYPSSGNGDAAFAFKVKKNDYFKVTAYQGGGVGTSYVSFAPSNPRN